jgi:hypothetical protein
LKKRVEGKDGAETKADEHVKERNCNPARDIREQQWRDWPVDTILGLEVSDKVKGISGGPYTPRTCMSLSDRGI